MTDYAITCEVPLPAPNFPVESGVAVPPPRPRGRPGREPVYPAERLEVGQSFFVPNGTLDRFWTNCSRWGRLYERKYICRLVEGGVRVWRTA